MVGLDLVGASRFVVAQLQAIERGGAGQRIALILFAAPIQAQRVALVCGHRDERVAPQRVMIVEILVTGGQAQHALGKELAEGMLDKEGLACVAKTGGQAAGQSQGAVELTQQEQTAIAAEVSSGEIGDDFAGIKILEEQGLTTRVRRRDLTVH